MKINSYNVIKYYHRIPRNLRDSWDPDAKMGKPNIGFDVEWVYGYRGKDASGGRNIYQVCNIPIVVIVLIRCRKFQILLHIYFTLYPFECLHCTLLSSVSIYVTIH